MILFKVLKTLAIIFVNFCINGGEQKVAKSHCLLKKALFSVLIPPTTNIECKYSEIFAVVDNILQKGFAVFYNILPLLT
jgi:hypothetical protein